MNFRTVNLYSITKPSTKEFSLYSKYRTGSTLKDMTSVVNIILESGQPWEKADKDKYMSNSITSVLVCIL